MKTIDKTTLILSLIILAIAFSIISIKASPAEIRYTWQGFNPWNTVQAVPLMFRRFLKMDAWITYSFSVLLIASLWWRIYALVKKLKFAKGKF